MIKKILAGIGVGVLGLFLINVFAPNALRYAAGFVLELDDTYDLFEGDED